MKRFLIVFMVLAPFFMSAAIGDNGISVDSKGNQLKWEEGRWDFFIMHKSLVERTTGAADNQYETITNPQADTCIDQSIGSTYTLTSKHIPLDANIDRAFLVWFSTQEPDNLNDKTDNSVTLSFKGSSSLINISQEITASKQGNLATTQTGDFEYEALNIPNSINGNTGVYTYRVDVTDFMKKIISTGASQGMDPGKALYGDYTVKGMECSNHENYIKTSGLVGGWFMPIVYTSSKISAKKIYFYNGLEAYRFQEKTFTVSGFELPEDALIKLGLVVFEGDPGLANTHNNMQEAEPEGLYISSQSEPANFVPISNDCNPPAYLESNEQRLNYTEIFNSISSVYGYADSTPYCIGGTPPVLNYEEIEYAIDADIFVVNSKESPFDTMFSKGDTEFNIKIGANQDQVYTNMLIVSIDTVSHGSDIVDTDDPTDTDTDVDTDTGDPTDNADTGDDSDIADSADTDDTADSESNNSENANPGMGELHGECRSDRTCNTGLICNSHNICKEEIKFSGCSALVF